MAFSMAELQGRHLVDSIMWWSICFVCKPTHKHSALLCCKKSSELSCRGALLSSRQKGRAGAGRVNRYLVKCSLLSA